jgi:hypothetical protein
VSASELRGLQRRFLALIGQRLPIEEAAQASGASPLGAWLRVAQAATPPSPAAEALLAERLAIYAHMYFARLRDSLCEDYPRTVELVGRATFDQLCVHYLERHPSEHPSLRYHGRRFPAFLRHAAPSIPLLEQQRPDLPDLSALEWARIEAFDAADVRVLSAERCANWTAEDWSLARLRSVPALRWVETELAIAELWRALAAGALPPLPCAGRELLLVWRRGFVVYHRRVEPREAAALRRLSGGATLAELAEAAELGAPGPAVEAERLVAWLRQWLADELIASP